MITRAQLEIYRCHWGEIDLLFREGSPAELAAVVGEPWRCIEALISDARRLDKGQLSAATAAELRNKIERNTADEATRQLLLKLARNYPRIRPRLPLFLLQSIIAGLLIGVFTAAEWLAESPVARRVVGGLLGLGVCMLVSRLVESLEH